jgi:hypothetical protein
VYGSNLLIYVNDGIVTSYVDHGNGNGSGIATAKQDPSASFVELQFRGDDIQGNFTDPNTVVGTITLAAVVHTYRLERIR